MTTTRTTEETTMDTTSPLRETMTAGTRWHNIETGIEFVVDRAFNSAGDWIVDYTITAGPHSVGCRSQMRLAPFSSLVLIPST